MQAFQNKFHFIGLLFLLSVACRPDQANVVTPTLIGSTRISALNTPTPISSMPPTPVITPRPGAISDDGRSIGDPYIPELGNSGYDVQSYLLQLTLDPKVVHVSGVTTIEAIINEDNLAQMPLDFIGFDIVRVSVAGAPAAFTREGRKLLVDLPQPLMAGTLLTVIVTYEGKPTREASPFVGFTDSLGLTFAGDGYIYTLSEPDGARYWFPCNDHPRDKAFFRFELTVPDGLTAIANGHLLDINNGESQAFSNGESGHTFVWRHDYPMATYLALVAVGPFERIEATSPGGVSLRHYVTEDFREPFEAAVSPTGEAIDWMSELFGPYPFETFGYVAASLPPTAMESQTMVIMSTQVVGQRTAVHELAHMWFGNWVSPNSWSEVWRKEGLASYVAFMWETQDDPVLLDQQMENIMAAVELNRPQYPIGDPPPQHLLGYNTYFKGAVFIHTLRREMGDEAFFGGLRAYLGRYGGGTASDEQFQAVMEEAAGYPLDEIFAQWLH